MSCWHCVYPDRQRVPSHAHFHNLPISCADSDWRSSVNQGRGSLFRHTGRLSARRPGETSPVVKQSDTGSSCTTTPRRKNLTPEGLLCF
jgi:hypothetical protein